jgi:hypothetical protein
LKEIHSNFKKIPLEYLSLPGDEPLLADMQITKESLEKADFDAFQTLMDTLSVADARVFMKLLISQGYDLWLT